MFQVFVGKIPKDVFEDELIPLIEQCGRIWDMRLMMDPMTGFNRGYCFVTYCDKDGAQECVKQVMTTKNNNKNNKYACRLVEDEILMLSADAQKPTAQASRVPDIICETVFQ